MIEKRIVSYTSKSGKTANYFVKREWKKDGQKRLLLQSFGEKSFEFWISEDQAKDPIPFKVNPNAPKKRCWECGSEFTWAEAQNNGGEWSEDYCGC